MIRTFVKFLPTSIIKFFGALQYKIPVVGPLIGKISKKFVAGQGKISRGLGKGLQIDASGFAPGFFLGTTDPLEQKAIEKFLSEGKVFFDIGANIGFFVY